MTNNKVVKISHHFDYEDWVSEVHSTGKNIDEEVQNHVHASWQKWKYRACARHVLAHSLVFFINRERAVRQEQNSEEHVGQEYMEIIPNLYATEWNQIKTKKIPYRKSNQRNLAVDLEIVINFRLRLSNRLENNT